MMIPPGGLRAVPFCPKIERVEDWCGCGEPIFNPDHSTRNG
jgi:hypothetical protein